MVTKHNNIMVTSSSHNNTHLSTTTMITTPSCSTVDSLLLLPPATTPTTAYYARGILFISLLWLIVWGWQLRYELHLVQPETLSNLDTTEIAATTTTITRDFPTFSGWYEDTKIENDSHHYHHHLSFRWWFTGNGHGFSSK
jgi:hypothetical protein